MNGYANLLRTREVPAGYRGTALIRVVLRCRHRVAVQQNIPCPSLDLVMRNSDKKRILAANASKLRILH